LQVRALPDPLRKRRRREQEDMALQEQLTKLREAGPRAVTFFAEVWSELRKVHWPSRKETYAATLIVVVVTFIVAVFLGVVDFAISHVVQVVLS
jgi:preprotein translocase subunit SecE